MSQYWIIIFFFYTITFFSVLLSVSSQPYLTANLRTFWINNVSTNVSMSSSDNSTIIPIFLNGSFISEFGCGFYCNGNCDSYLFAIFIADISRNVDDSFSIYSSQVVWSTNRNNPVGINGTLQLTAEGDLVLKDADGTLAWSTDTAGRSVAGLNLTERGNLVLFDGKNSIVWQSFDHPTDCLLPGQILVSGMNLTAGLYSVSMTDKGLVASILSDPPQIYSEIEASYAKLQNGRLRILRNGSEIVLPDISVAIQNATSAQYMKLGADGHLRVFVLLDLDWNEVADLLKGSIGVCDYPMVCGRFGICLSNGQCSCPRSRSYQASFLPLDYKHPELGCYEAVPLTCNASDNHSFLDLDSVTYFAFNDDDIIGTDRNSCKEACSRNCSCKAVVFVGDSDNSYTGCYLPSQIFSFRNIDNANSPPRFNYSVSIKVQIAPTGISPNAAAKGKTRLFGPILGSILGVCCVAVVIGTVGMIYRKKRRRFEEVEEDYLDQVPGLPTRFSFQELASATGNFDKKLGEGGFGSVFEGSLHDGTRVAVKRLDGVGHIKKSFLAEVESIGSIHHNNLVRLIGFCSEKFHRLLVYEFMCNGSLERWIYCKSHEPMLEWSYRKKIILDIAKGLAYLHEDCRQKIIHLDIKPQNILLDEHYNAKLADFGLAKLVDRNQSKVVTTMRGTPGYLAPEWLSAVITEKVDVYSFGVVILEILCGRKVFDQSRPEEERHLPTLFMKKAEEGQWLDLVDKCCLDVESNGAQVEEIMQIAAWCIQSDHEKRPCMSMVIKILEGVVDVQKDINYSMVPHYLVSIIPEFGSRDSTPLLPSVLSGPR